MTRTDETRRCCAPLIEPLAPDPPDALAPAPVDPEPVAPEPVEPELVVPEPVVPAVEPEPEVVPLPEPEPEPEPDMLVSSVPVTSTRFPAFDWSCDCAEPPSRMYVEPEPEPMLALEPEPPADPEPVVPAPPAVLPLPVDPLVDPPVEPVVDPPVEPVVDPPVEPLVEPEPEPEPEPMRDPDELPDPLDMLAFVRMNDAPFPLPDAERDALVPDVELPLVDPDVPVAPPMSPDCRQPVTVIVPLCPDRFEPLCCDPEVWLLPLCAATIAVHPTPIANIHAARFIKASSSYRVRHERLQAIRHHAPARAPEASQWV
jgi:hypothetical protein